MRGDVREVVRLPRVPRGLQHGAVVAAVPAPTSRIRSALHKRQSARYSDSDRRWRGCRDTGVGNAMLLVEQQFQRRTLPGKRASCRAMQVSRYCASAWLHGFAGTLPEAQESR